jgi:hypothetical protein
LEGCPKEGVASPPSASLTQLLQAYFSFYRTTLKIFRVVNQLIIKFYWFNLKNDLEDKRKYIIFAVHFEG